MLPFHRRLAKIGLLATSDFGFVLAGGYAISANGMGDRPSEDVDLFTDRPDPDQFAVAVGRLRQAYLSHSLEVEDERIRPTFADLHVTDSATGETSNVQLGLDFRAFPPATLDIGPVLDARDAVGGKMSALWSRGEARDYIDIAMVIDSDRFSREDVLAIADRLEATPLDRRMLAVRFRGADRYDERTFARYGVDADERTRLIARFAAWADDIDPL
ncbi:MAG: nucleotidyl transferase AbiEii/AbiGii toxin family protein [Micropruina sp.]|uniref:nucleotidyl transferase AbiEii/AbiGii toxin family protein n=1 Tax=Micropruina sp. TaxID=2737536 RepID=UPI0039E3951D